AGGAGGGRAPRGARRPRPGQRPPARGGRAGAGARPTRRSEPRSIRPPARRSIARGGIRAMAEDFPCFDLAGQSVLVTGAARGLGHACALACARAGADIALGLRDAKAPSATAVAREVEALGRRALPLQMDVARLDQIEPAIAAAEAAFGHLDVLVNNAGI